MKLATRHFQISDAWLDAHAADANAYIDLMEIRRTPLSSLYLQWLETQAGFLGYEVYRQRLSFYDHGILIGGNAIQEPNTLTGNLADDGYTGVNIFDVGVLHDFRYNRIYAQGTAARRIWIVGFDHRAYDSRDDGVINAHGLPY